MEQSKENENEGNSFIILSSAFEKEMNKVDPSLTPSFANISTTPASNLSAALASLLNCAMYSHSGSSAPCLINYRSTFV